MKMSKLYFGIDFDGTCVEHKYPMNGNDLPNAVNVLKQIIDKKHSIVINTMRDRAQLTSAQEWFKSHDIPVFGVNRNPTQVWTKSPKVYAHIYIDDAALGCPLMNHARLKDETCEAMRISNKEWIELDETEDSVIYVLDPSSKNMNSNDLIEAYLFKDEEEHKKLQSIFPEHKMTYNPIEKIMIKASYLKIPPESRDFVDWFRVEEMLKKMNVI